MRILLVIFLPWLNFFTIGRPISGIVCMVLQMTFIGWAPAAIWSAYALGKYQAQKKLDRPFRLAESQST